MPKKAVLAIGLLVAAGTCSNPAPRQDQEAIAQTARPDTGARPPAVELSTEERELLLRLKGAASPFATRGQAGENRPKAVVRPPGMSLVQDIEALDKLLSKASLKRNSTTSRLFLDLMNAPEPQVRVTALHWLAGWPAVSRQAFSMALRDKHELVRSVAAQLLLDRGVSETTLTKMRAAAAKDPAALERMLRHSLPVQ